MCSYSEIVKSHTKDVVKFPMDYVMSILYHSHKANVVVDDLSRLSMGSTTQYKKDKEELVKDMHRLAR